MWVSVLDACSDSSAILASNAAALEVLGRAQAALAAAKRVWGVEHELEASQPAPVSVDADSGTEEPILLCCY